MNTSARIMLDVATIADAIAPGAHSGEDAPVTAAKLGQASLENMADELSVIVEASTSPLGGMTILAVADLLHRIATRAKSAAHIVSILNRTGCPE